MKKKKRSTAFKPYAEVSQIKDPGNICLINKQNYNVSISVDLSSNEMYSVQSVFDTAVGLKLIRERIMQNERLEVVRAISRPSWRRVASEKVINFETVLHNVRIRHVMSKCYSEK